MKTKLTFLVIIFFSFHIHAQNRGCDEKVIQFSEFVKLNNFSEAFLPWYDVRKKCPSLDERIYSSGTKILQYKIDNASTTDEKEIIVRDLLKLYDEHDKNFPKNNKGNGVNKAMVLHENKVGTSEEIYTLLDNAFKENPKNVTNANALYVYFDLFYSQYKEGKKEIQPDDVFVKRDAIAARISIASKSDSADDIESYKRVLEGVDALISGLAVCDKLIPFYQKNYDFKKSDALWLENATTSLLSKKCASDPLFAKMAAELHQIKPSSRSAYNLGIVALNNKSQMKAIAYFNESAELNMDLNEKAKTYYMIATFLSNSNKSEAREYARKAAVAYPSFGKTYLLIAQLYANSDNECGETPFEKKAIYYLAAETAKKAGEVDPFLKITANKQAEAYLKKAPSKEEIKAAKRSGKNITFNCWINESVMVPKL
jgi:tetratricopeptide (TPR) repeat protein